MSEDVLRYFPSLNDDQKEKLHELKDIYSSWNTKINVISRKDINNLMVHHVLHSLSISKVIRFMPGTRIIDVGSGGGFPGIPLAIMFPGSQFTLIDSVGKKIKVVKEVAGQLKLGNVIAINRRVEDEKEKYHFVTGRAVTGIKRFRMMTVKNIEKKGFNNLDNGILYLTGGDIRNELSQYTTSAAVWNISEFFSEPYFETKKIIYLARQTGVRLTNKNHTG